MSKIKEQLLRQQDTQMEYYMKVMEDLKEVFDKYDTPYTSEELDQMEKEHLSSHPFSSKATAIIPNTTVNNTEINTRKTA
jgi:hypothetical protein